MLVVIKDLGITTRDRTVVVKCDCGIEREYTWSLVRRNKLKSCGCYRNELLKNFYTKGIKTHNLTKHPLYKIWSNIKGRCSNPNFKNYKYYGERGIKMCDEWINSFISFYDWAIVTYEKGLDIDRIDVNGNYEPSNCRFATKTQNARNRRNNVLLYFNGESKCIAEWAKDLGVTPSMINKRISRWGMDAEKILSTPPNMFNKQNMKKS